VVVGAPKVEVVALAPKTFLFAFAELGAAPSPLKNPPPPPDEEPPKIPPLDCPVADVAPNVEVVLAAALVVACEVLPPKMEDVGWPDPKAGFPPKTDVEADCEPPKVDEAVDAVVAGVENADEPPNTDVPDVAPKPVVAAEVVDGADVVPKPNPDDAVVGAAVGAIVAPKPPNVELPPNTDGAEVVAVVPPKTLGVDPLVAVVPPKTEVEPVADDAGVLPKIELLPVDCPKTDLIAVGAEVAAVDAAGVAAGVVTGVATGVAAGVADTVASGDAPKIEVDEVVIVVPKIDLFGGAELAATGVVSFEAVLVELAVIGGLEVCADVGAPNTDDPLETDGTDPNNDFAAPV